MEIPEEIILFGNGVKCSEIACVMANYFTRVMVNPVISGKESPFKNASIDEVNESHQPNLLFLKQFRERILIEQQADHAVWLIAVSPEALSFIVNELKPGPDTVLWFYYPGNYEVNTPTNEWNSCLLNFYFIGNWRKQNLIELFPAKDFPVAKLKRVTDFLIEMAGKKALVLKQESLSQTFFNTIQKSISSFCLANAILPRQIEPLTGPIIGGPAKGIFKQLGLEPQLMGDELVMSATPAGGVNEQKKIKVKTSGKTKRVKKVIRKARKLKSIAQKLHYIKRQTNFIGEFYQQFFTDQLRLISALENENSDFLHWIDLIYKESFGYQVDLAEWLPIVRQYFDGKDHDPQQKELFGFSIVRFYDSGNRNVDLKKLAGNIIWQNEESRIYDLGDGVLNFEFHSRLNILGPLVMAGLEQAYETAESSYKSLIIGNQGANFSVGANLGIIFLHVLDRDYRSLAEMIRRFQFLIQKARYSSVPVVVAPHSMALGGAVELSLHADLVHPSIETYAGLVESKVGLIPGGGGTTALTIKSWQEAANGSYDLLLESFASMLLGRLSGSALEAVDFCYFPEGSPISHSRDRHLYEAKNSAIERVQSGYQQPVRRKVEVTTEGVHALELELESLTKKHDLTPYQVEIGEKLIRIMTGNSKRELTEPELLELECETFLHLLGRKKTLERIWSVFTKGTPIKN